MRRFAHKEHLIMPRTISAPDAQASFDELLADVQDGIPTEIVQNGQRVAVVISAEAFDRLRKERLERAWKGIDDLRERNAHLDPDEVMRDVTEIVEEVRQEMYEERLSAVAREH
jgi:prevent-host-death family protein